jgi:hypothetical protein
MQTMRTLTAALIALATALSAAAGAQTPASRMLPLDNLGLEQHQHRALEVVGHWHEHLDHLRLEVEAELLAARQIGRHRHAFQIGAHVVVRGSRQRQLELARIALLGGDGLRQSREHGGWRWGRHGGSCGG